MRLLWSCSYRKNLGRSIDPCITANTPSWTPTSPSGIQQVPSECPGKHAAQYHGRSFAAGGAVPRQWSWKCAKHSSHLSIALLPARDDLEQREQTAFVSELLPPVLLEWQDALSSEAEAPK